MKRFNYTLAKILEEAICWTQTGDPSKACNVGDDYTIEMVRTYNDYFLQVIIYIQCRKTETHGTLINIRHRGPRAMFTMDALNISIIADSFNAFRALAKTARKNHNEIGVPND
jgi:hypothetical protein